MGFDRLAASYWPAKYYMSAMEGHAVNAGARNERGFVITSWLLLTNAPGQIAGKRHP
jgi:hypothetical protein